MTAEQFEKAVSARMQQVCNEKEILLKKFRGTALPSAARTVRAELDTAILKFARKWEPRDS